MNCNLFYAVLFGITSFGFFKLHKWWLKERIENEESKSFTCAGTFKHWLIIIGLAIAAIVNFFIAIG
jgi:predicted Co/Zn/Cd cation transporter (cation efflux family)